MMRVPVAPSALGGVISWARELTDYVASLEPNQTPDALLTRTTRGTTSTPTAEDGGAGESNTLQFKGQWSFLSSYVTGDIVIREDPSSEIPDGTLAGTYIANADVSPGDLPPGVPAVLATATADVSIGVVTGGTIVGDGGMGYSTAPAVSITGDGTGATAHATVLAGSVTSIVIDTGGTGYTSAAISIGDPDQVQKWDDFSNEGHSPKRVYRIDKMVVIVDVSVPAVVVLKDYSDATQGAILCDVAMLLTLGATTPVIEPRLYDYCDAGVAKKVVLMGTEPFVP